MCQEFVTDFIETPLCAGVSGSQLFCCLHVFFVSVSGSGTSKWAGDLYLTPSAKICFACWRFPPSSFASSLIFFLRSAPCFLLSSLCLFTFTVDGNHRVRKMQPGTRLFSAFLRLFLPLFSSLKCRRSGMLGVSKLASVLGVPGEQPRHNSRVEWAGERRGGKMNSMLWGFPNPNSLQGLCRLHCAEFTRIYPSWQTIQPVMKDKGWKMFCGFLTLWLGEKYRGQAWNTVNLQRRTCLNLLLFVLHCCILGSVFDSTLPHISQLVLSLFPLFSEIEVCTCMPTWWSAYGMRACHCPCMCARMSVCVCVSLTLHSSLWILVQRRRPRYGCKS